MQVPLPTDLDFTISRLGECRVPSPMSGVRFARDDERVLYPSTPADLKRLRSVDGEPAAMDLR